MYDTLVLKLYSANDSKIKALPNRTKGGRVIYNLKNLQLSSIGQSWYLIGSIAKYILGENALSISNEQYLEALKDIETAIDTDLHRAIVLRFDYGFCFFSKSIELLDCLQDCKNSRFARVLTYHGKTLETVLYKTKERAFCVYRKDIEADKALKAGVYLYRLEYRQLTRQGIKRLFFGVDISPYSLALPKCRDTLKKRFFDFYKDINKDFDKISFCNPRSQKATVKDIKNTLSALWVKDNKERFKSLCACLPKTDKIRLENDIKAIKPPFYAVCDSVNILDNEIKVFCELD